MGAGCKRTRTRPIASAATGAAATHRSRSALPARASAACEDGTPPQPPSVVGAFDSDLHVWGRPFFIVADQPQEVSEWIDRYVDADAEAATQIAREMVRRLNPELLDGPPAQVFPKHVTRNIDDLPDDAAVEREVRWKVELFRDCYQALASGRRVSDDQGRNHDPDELFATDFATAMMDFAAIFRPGWMDRGTVWPTHLMARAGLNPAEFFASPDPLFEPLLERIPQIRKKYDVTITQNFMLGGYVSAGRVPALLDHFQENLPRLAAVYESHRTADVPIYLRKQLEALHDAARREIGFIEATEIYSGPLGVMN